MHRPARGAPRGADLPHPARRRRRPTAGMAAATAVVLATTGCGVSSGGEARPATPLPAASAPPAGQITTAVATTTAAPPTTATTTTATTATTTSPTTIAPTTTTATTTTSTTTTSTTIADPAATLPIVPIEVGPLDLTADLVGLGFSAEGRPMFAERYGVPGGRRVLVVGVIHGNEDDGLAIVDELRRREVPDGVELWLVESMNPDGVANQDRHNANDVDLNRNFPYNWGPIGQPGDSQYAGVGPASEPETQAMVNLIEQLRPDIAIWYHQDAYLVIPSTGRDGRIRARYAELTGLPLADCCGGGGIYTGIAATWARQELLPVEGVAFIVELGGTTSPDEVATHADAVITIAGEG